MNLRPMTIADAEKMLEWKNYPETRQFAIQSHEEIKREDHIKWLEDNVQYFDVIEFYIEPLNTTVKAGAIRIFEGEISIWIDRAFRGKGVATRAIKKLAEADMVAKIVDGNVGSLRAFIKAGFLPVEHIDNYYLLKL
jgi:Acetyltransferases, including N-acetylases of ribosomal proteins